MIIELLINNILERKNWKENKNKLIAQNVKKCRPEKLLNT